MPRRLRPVVHAGAPEGCFWEALAITMKIQAEEVQISFFFFLPNSILMEL